MVAPTYNPSRQEAEAIEWQVSTSILFLTVLVPLALQIQRPSYLFFYLELKILVIFACFLPSTPISSFVTLVTVWSLLQICLSIQTPLPVPRVSKTAPTATGLFLSECPSSTDPRPFGSTSTGWEQREHSHPVSFCAFYPFLLTGRVDVMVLTNPG